VPGHLDNQQCDHRLSLHNNPVDNPAASRVSSRRCVLRINQHDSQRANLLLVPLRNLPNSLLFNLLVNQRCSRRYNRIQDRPHNRVANQHHNHRINQSCVHLVNRHDNPRGMISSLPVLSFSV
jgi:hypothetical protein